MNNEDLKFRAFQKLIGECRMIFEKKTKDYGTAWIVLRLPSLTDQIYIKARRIRSIQEKGKQKVSDNSMQEFMGMVNYGAMALIKIKEGTSLTPQVSASYILKKYDEVMQDTLGLFEKKNHDYDEAWKSMRISSMTDIILMKLLRIKQIEDNEGQTLVSEGVGANYQDIINYSLFCMALGTQDHVNPS